ncbi:hypothetical protein LUZ61_010356 [Rhynchospora tenuis]|uniref:Bidirectional sugar transporter SWEET n=1 Tax=Rhynchospora tenuis TaxID=198213 RepID=A0AAD5ZYZ6_9POAL|nr:hypothetical protein LUZ61_010356 [Rhynchospora tenuis]
MDVVRFIFGILGNATALFLFLSPIVTFRRIIRKRSTEDFSGVPYNMTMLNCLLSAWYGLPFISPNNILVSTINGTGAVIEAVYVMIFLIFAPPKMRIRMFGLLTVVISIFSTVALVSLLALHGQPQKGCRWYFSSVVHTPLHQLCLRLRLVIKTKSVEYMPFLLSLFVFFCGTSWFIYGLLGGDPFVAVPNGCGSFLGALQLILYATYRNNKVYETDSSNSARDSSVEMEQTKHTNSDGSTNTKDMEKGNDQIHQKIVSQV